MSVRTLEPAQRVVQVGDKLRLEFVGVGDHGDPQDFTVTPTGNTRCWSSLLLGKKAGSQVELPEREGNVVLALITGISRP